MAAEHTHDRIDAEEIAHHVATKLAEIGQRFTSSRRDIISVLARTDRPLSIPEILEITPDLAQSSAYRNLTVLENVGVVTRVITTDEWARYELSEDLMGHHHHMVCHKCGSVGDMRIPEQLEIDLDKVLGRIAVKAGFLMGHHRLDVVGICKACR